MIYYILTILLISLIFLGLYRIRLTKICSICAGVLLTWVIGLIGLYINSAWANPLIVGILMGATLGALADKYGSRFGLLWKYSVVLFGLVSIYLLVQHNWISGLIILGIIGIITMLIYKPKSTKTEAEKDLFKNCC